LETRLVEGEAVLAREQRAREDERLVCLAARSLTVIRSATFESERAAARLDFQAKLGAETKGSRAHWPLASQAPAASKLAALQLETAQNDAVRQTEALQGLVPSQS
jgi:hypothetical protein